MAPKAAKQPEVFELPPLDMKTIALRIVGDSPLIVHAWSKKAREQMLAKQMGRAQQKKEPKNPTQDYQDCFYFTPDGAYGFPAVAFKAAAVDAASQVGGLTKVFLRGCFHVVGEMVKIDGEPRMREDMVKIAMGTADIRYRPEFPEWATTLFVRFNRNAITMEQLVHLFAMAGFACGVGEWRPQRDGAYGMFRVESIEEIA